MKKAFIVLCLICLCSGSVYASESADVSSQTIDPASASINTHPGQELIKTRLPEEIPVGMQRELMELKEELRKEVYARTDSARNGIYQVLAFIGTLMGIWGWSKVKQAEREYDRAEKEMREIRDKYQKQANEISKVYYDAKKMEKEIVMISGRNLDPDKPLNSDDVETIEEIISKPAVSIVTRLQAMALKMQGNEQWDKSIFLWEILVGLNPSCDIMRSADFYIAYCLFKIKKYKESSSKLEELCNNGVRDYRLYLYWGKSLVRQGDFEGAIEKSRKALSFYPNSYSAYLNWGRALSGQKNFDGAIEKFQEALKRNPGSYSCYLNWGKALLGQKNFDGAIEKFQEALRLNSESSSTYLHLGKALLKQKNFDGAIENFQEALRLNPESYSAYLNWSRALSQLSKGITDPDRKHELEKEAKEKLLKAKELGYESDSSVTNEEE